MAIAIILGIILVRAEGIRQRNNAAIILGIIGPSGVRAPAQRSGH